MDLSLSDDKNYFVPIVGIEGGRVLEVDREKQGRWIVIYS